MAQTQRISTEDLAFSVSEKTIDRIFDINRKLMIDEWSKQIKELSNPVKMLMTEAYVEGYKRGNERSEDAEKTFQKGRASAFEDSLEVIKDLEVIKETETIW